jgi:epoxyqueuosine reductase
MDLYESVHECAVCDGADFVGVADLSTAREAILEQGGALVASFPRGVAIGIELVHSIVDQMPDRFENPAHARNYGQHCYTLINQRLDLIASRVAAVIQRAGHRVYPIPASQMIDAERRVAVFSNKVAAHLAGLGWIGKSCLLVTPTAGPRVRWATVLTDAPLNPTGQPMQPRCGSCTECVDACPAHAFTGREFRADEDRDLRFDTQKCHEYREESLAKHGFRECGLCLWACPHGRAASRRLGAKK